MSNSNKDFFKITKKGKKLPPPLALSHETLLTKSKLHAKRSIDAKAGDLEVECQLWAASALELLAKAQLAGIHPSLVVDTANTNSLLEANGIKCGTPVHTITAATAYARLKHTVPNFSTPVHDECKKLAERRNAELHSGEAACAAMPYDSWEPDFWNAADLILKSMDMDLQEWLGAGGRAPRELLKTYRQAEIKAARQRVKHHATEFKASPLGKLGKAKFAELVQETAARPISEKDFHYLYVKHWHHVCPACKTMGVAAGDEAWEEVADDQDEADPGYQIVERGYSPSEFHCPTCGLSLVGDLAVSAAGIDETLVETREEEIKYEPEYGND